MSVLSIAPYFPFRRIKIVKQTVFPNAGEARIQGEPDRRFQPICHFCGQKATTVHSLTQRTIRDLNLTTARVWLTCRYRKLFCPHCHLVGTEDLELFHPYLRVTTHLALYIYQLCRFMTVAEVAQHVGLDWKTVKNIDKMYLETKYGQPDYEGLRILAVDEIAVHKGQKYLTVVLDYLSGRIVFVGKDRKAKTLKRFFNNRIIDKIRNGEFRKASNENKNVFKGAKYLLLKNRENIRLKKHREQLNQLLKLNEVINTVMILKDQLKHIWSYRSRTWANKAIDHWCTLAKSLNNRSLNGFYNMLNRYRYGILNHCNYPIHTGKLEGVNNKIKVIKRKAYGFHDLPYFTLKIYQVFYN